MVQVLNTSMASSPYFNVFMAAQVKANDRGFLSKDITVKDMISLRGDIHHIYPKNLLKKQNKQRGEYNQIANYAFTQQEINIKIRDKSPEVYFKQMLEQCHGGEQLYGGIANLDDFNKNLKMNCIQNSIFEIPAFDYERFLSERRELMAKKIKEYYNSL